MDISIQLAPKNKRGLLLANPVMTSSGTFGYGTEYSQLFDVQKLGQHNPYPTKRCSAYPVSQSQIPSEKMFKDFRNSVDYEKGATV